MSGESSKPPAASNSSALALNYIYTKMRLKYDGSCLKQDKVTFTHKKWLIFILSTSLWPLNVAKDFALVYYRATWATFKPKLKKIKKSF